MGIADFLFFSEFFTIYADIPHKRWKMWYNNIMKVYLDNCCYNHPYDDQSYLSISLEAQAKLLVQSLVRAKKLKLASSFVLDS